ncbi:MAG: ornithine carbamoyltransferase [Gemmatimonadota bacterium]
MPKRDFLTIADFNKDELNELVDLAIKLKKGKGPKRPLEGQTLGMIFAKSSTRTRVSFEVGMYQLGGHALFLSARDIQLGRGEPVRDMARVLSRYLDAIMIRTFAQSEVEELARYATIPVINGLTDLHHPCQILADLMTMKEQLGGWDKKTVAWIGDGNNMANSWVEAAGILGFELRVAAPKGYEPDKEIFRRYTGSTKLMLTRSIEEAAKGADVVTTDVWASMGQEEEQAVRAKAFKDFVVDDQLMGLARSKAIFLHCLPAHRGEEVSESVLEGAASKVWDQAENRLHAQKALLIMLMRGKGKKK